MKLKTVYICSECQHTTSKWEGKCPKCNAWNSFVEDVVDVKADRKPKGVAKKATTLETSVADADLFATGIKEFDLVLSGGVALGSLILLAGEPGIGKSTLTMQLCKAFVDGNKKTLYVSAEESLKQVSQRAKRLNAGAQTIHFIQEYAVENIIATIEDESPDLLIVDSIQVIASEAFSSAAGSMSQVRACTEALMEITKKRGMTTIIIGHVTKEGSLAGPRALEHLVDTVLQLEGDRYHDMRILRSVKNRFGANNEVGLFELCETGLISIENPVEKLLKERSESTYGSCLTCVLEGNRPIILEVQALTTTTVFGYPKRSATGYDTNRLNMIIAILQRHAKIDLLNQDVYVNVIGGFKIGDPSADLAVAMAICSSFKKQPLPRNNVYMGELGLTGEVRGVRQERRRVQEIDKLQLAIPSKERFISKAIQVM